MKIALGNATFTTLSSNLLFCLFGVGAKFVFLLLHINWLYDIFRLELFDML